MACPCCGRSGRKRSVGSLLDEVIRAEKEAHASKQRMLDMIMEDFEVRVEKDARVLCGDVYRAIAFKLNKSVSIRIVRDVRAALELLPKELRVHRYNRGGPKYFRHLVRRSKEQ